MKPEVGAPRVRDYAQILARGWLIILCATLLSAGAAQVVAMTRPPQYVASVQLFATVAGDAGVRAAYEGNRGAATQMLTYGQLATSEQVAARAVDQLGLREAPAELAKRVSVRLGPISPITFQPTDVLMGVDVASGDPQSAVDEANAVATNLVALSGELQTSDSGPAASLVVVDDAKSAHRVRASLLDTAGMGAAIGFALACVLVLARGIATDRVLGRGQIDHIARRTGSDQHGSVT